MKALDMAKEAIELWKKGASNYIVPAVEWYVLAMVASSIVIFSLVALMMASLFIIFFGLIGGFLIGTDLFSLYFMFLLWPLLMLLVVLLALPFIMMILAFINGVLVGGLSKTVLSTMAGNTPKFGDVSRTGWHDRWPLFKISLIKMVVMVMIMAVPMSVITMMLFPLLLFPFFGILLYYMAIMVISVGLGAVTTPLNFLPYIMYWREKRRGWDAVHRSISFISLHWRESLGLGLLYQAASLVLAFIPGIGILLGLVGPSFILTCLNLLYEEKMGKQGQGA